MSAANSAPVQALLADSLALWQVKGMAAAGQPEAEAMIRSFDGTVVWVIRARAVEHPIRWWVRWQMPDGTTRSRPSASVVGLLRSVRDALNVDIDSRLRIGSVGDAT
jgi:hypothetical protein